jgi:hypothetical protein
VVNVSSQTARITATLNDATGAISTSKVLTLAPGAQSAQFFEELMGQSEATTGAAYDSVIFDGGSSAELGAIALSYDGVAQTSVPVDSLR